MDEFIPSEFYLAQNYPNPFKERTVIKYCVAYKTRVQITVHNSEGEEIEKLVDEEKQPGTYEVDFNTSEDCSGKARQLSNGYYFYHMKAGDYSSDKKWLYKNNLLRRNSMKTLIQILLFFLLLTQICFGQWVQLGLEDKSIKDIGARNSNIFAVTTDSSVYRSTDNGVNWLQIVDSCAIDIAISPSGSMFMIKDYLHTPFPPDSLYRSSDNGNTWVNLNIIEQLPPPIDWSQPANVTISPMEIVFCGISQSSMVGSSTSLALSTDDGLTWTSPGWEIYSGDLFDFRGQSVITSGWLAHTYPIYFQDDVYLSSDNGQNWLNIGDPPLFRTCNNVLRICMNGNILMGGFSLTSSGLFISSDSCNTWTQVSSLIPEAGLSIESGGVLVGTDTLGVFLFSDNGDSLGSRNDGLSNLNIHTFTMDNNGYVYAGTDNGVWRRPLSEITSVEEEKITGIPTEFLLSQNYPNPFNPTTKIKYSVPQPSNVVIKVFGILGNEMETLVNEEKSVGTYEVTWYAENLPSGVYFYQLKTGEYVQTNKMILLK